MDHPSSFDLVAFYDEYPRVEEQFQEALTESLNPSNPDLLYDLVTDLGLGAQAKALDVGCGEGGHTILLAERFGFTISGVDPVTRHIELAEEELATAPPELRERVSFVAGSVERLPVADSSIDLIWCRDVLVHVEDLDTAYAQFRRVLRPGGRALVYQMFGTARLEPKEAAWLWGVMGVVPSSADPRHTERAVAAAGLEVERCIDLGSEWGEYADENRGSASRKLLTTARLLRDPDRYTARFGQAAYDIMLGDCLWHIYRMIGKLSPRIYLLRGPQEETL